MFESHEKRTRRRPFCDWTRAELVVALLAIAIGVGLGWVLWTYHHEPQGALARWLLGS
jgi:hypothetical protein